MAKFQQSLASKSTTKSPSSKFALSNFNFTLPALGLVLVGLILRLIGLGARPLWFDEVISVVYARQDVSSLIALNSGDNHPVGYYLTLKAWITLFGTSDAAVRLLSVLPGVASLWLVWLLGRRLFPSEPRLALLALALTALSPFQIYFSQEVRNYSIMEFFGLGAIWFGLRAFANDATGANRWLNWVGLGLCGTLGLLCNLTTAFYLLALGLIPFFQFRRNWQNGVLPRLFLTGLATGLLSGLALLPKLLSRLDVIKDNFWIPTPNPLIVLHTFYAFIFGAIQSDRFVLAFGLAFIILALTLAAVLPAAYRQISSSSATETGLLRTLWLLFGPIGLIIVVSLLFQPLYLDKALIACAPFYYLLIAWAIFRPDARRKVTRGRGLLASLPTVVALVLALSALPALYDGTIAPRYIVRYDAADLNEYLRQNAQPGDVVATASDITWLPLVYYGPNQFPSKYPIKEYPYFNIFPLLLEKLNSEFVPRADFVRRFGAKRLWVVYEVQSASATESEGSLKQPPRPATLTGESNWTHSVDWQRDLLAYYDQQYSRLQTIAIDRVILVLYQV